MKLNKDQLQNLENKALNTKTNKLGDHLITTLKMKTQFGGTTEIIVYSSWIDGSLYITTPQSQQEIQEYI